MRTTLLIAGTILLLAAAFVGYFWIQPHTPLPHDPARVRATAPQAIPPPRPGQGVVQQGRGVWTKLLDEKTGQVKSEFRGEEFLPQDDNTVTVIAPQARFYLAEGRVLVIEGQRGRVVMPTAPLAGEQLDKPQTQMPTRGELHHVLLSLLPARDAAEPLLVCRMKLAAFDNETFTIATEAYTADDGTHVPADQVAVEVRGVDYDFDGRGLTIRWNQLDRRLQLLEIAHGERLVVKNPDARLLGDALGSAVLPMNREHNNRVTRRKPFTTALAVADRGALAILASDVSEARGAQPDASYTARFNDSVRIVQGDEQLVQADTLRIDFLLDEETAPTPDKPAEPAARERSPATPRDPAEEPEPAELEVAEPITIYWTGPLRVTPRDEPGAKPLAPKSAWIHLQGAPVILERDGSRVECAAFAFSTEDQSGRIESSREHPEVVLQDASGAKVTTPLIEIEAGEVAILRGKSFAQIPLDEQPAADGEAGEPQMMSVAWTETCQLTFTKAGNDRLIERAEIAGIVHVEHPELQLEADALNLAFHPAPVESQHEGEPKHRAELRDLVASGDVHCVIRGDEGNHRTFECQRLQLATERTAGGALFARVIDAEGGVHTFDDEQELRAGHLTLLLSPAKRDEAQAHAADGDRTSTRVVLERMEARQDVMIDTADGRSARGDELLVESDNGDYRLKMRGEPATLVGDDGTISGPVIEMDTAAEHAAVIGAGKLHALQQRAGDAAPRPIDVAWSSGLRIDGKANVVEVEGDVAVESSDAPLSTQEARSKKLMMTLADAPVRETRGDAEVGDDEAIQANRRGGDLLGSAELKLNFLDNKVVQTITLQEDVDVRAVELSEQGDLLRRMNLLAAAVEYDLAGEKLIVPVPGRLLVQDDRPREQAADHAENDAGGASRRHGESLRGATAFAWQRELRYEREAGQLQMNGNVVIVHQSSDLTGPKMRLEADAVIADLEPLEEPPDAADAASEIPGASRMRLKRVTAQGNVVFTSNQLRFEGHTIVYDPETETLEARGTAEVPLVWYDETGVSKGRAESLIYDLRTEQVKAKAVTGGTRR